MNMTGRSATRHMLKTGELIRSLPEVMLSRPHTVFLIVAITWGILTVFITPPFQMPDEPNHFYKTFFISTGRIFPETRRNLLGGTLPVSLLKTTSLYEDIPFHPGTKAGFNRLVRASAIPLNQGDTSFVFFPNTAHQLPVPYLPQVMFMTGLRLCQLSPVFLLYAGRLGNLFCWILLIYLSIRITPFHKWIFLLLALLPMSVFQAASLSPDAMTNGLAFLLTASVFRLAFNRISPVTVNNVFMIVVLSVLLSLSKNAYFLVVLCIFLVPLKSMPSLKAYVMRMGLILVVTGVAVVTGALFIRHIYRDIDMSHGIYVTCPEFPQQINPDAQLAFITSDVPGFFSICVRSLWHFKTDIGSSFVGNLGWLDTPLPVWYVVISLIFIVVVTLYDRSQAVTLSGRNRLVMLASLFGVIMVLSVIMYMIWTPVGASLISGFQGRYFIPVAPLAAALLYNRRLKFSESAIPIASGVFLLISFVVMNLALVSRYYL